MIDARTIALLDLLHHGYYPPAPGHPDHDRLMHAWAHRFRVRLACAEGLLDAVAAIEAEEPACPPSP